MTLPHSHSSGASVRHPFDISKNQIEKHPLRVASSSDDELSPFEDSERFEAAFNTGLSAKIILNDDLEIMDINRLFRAWFKDVLPKTCIGVRVDETPIFTKTTLWEIRNRIDLGIEEINTRFLVDCSVKGNLRHLQLSVSSFSGYTPTSLFMLDLVDVTELEENKTGWSESRLQLAKQDAEFKKVAKVISHDLRGPAINISNLIGLLESTENTEIDPELLKGLKTSVNSILDKLNNSGSDLNNHLQQISGIKKMSIGASIERVLESILLEDYSSDVNIKFEAYDTSDWGISEELLKMVLGQLISNSTRFCNPDKESIINISAFKRNGNRIISVTDNGVGINLNGQEQRLFGLFQTFHKHPDARGVGLFQVKNRMKSVGGDVLLESEVGKGTTVTLNFN